MSGEKNEHLIATLEARFTQYSARHNKIHWKDVQAKLEANPSKLKALAQMEETGGEPDVIGVDKQSGEFLFVDCAAESPKGRRSLCYDKEARTSRKDHPPKNSAIEMAAAMGIELLTEAQYRQLQTLGEFDLKTSSWVLTPKDIRKLGGALFCDRRYNSVFLYHNGAQSYYAARGFRGMLKV